MSDEQTFPLGCTDADQLFVLTHRLRGSPAFGQFLARDRAGDCYLATTTLSHGDDLVTVRKRLEFAIAGVTPLTHVGRLLNRELTAYDLLVEAMPSGVPSACICKIEKRSIQIARLGLSLGEIAKHLHERGEYFGALRPQTIFVDNETSDVSITSIAPRSDLFYFSADKPDLHFAPAFEDTYSAPELWLGSDICSAADVFSICAILAFWLQGRSPFVGDTFRAQAMAIMRNQRAFVVPQASALGKIVERGLNPNPASRPTLSEVAAVLESSGASRDP